VDTAQIALGAVGTNQLAGGAVDLSKMAANSVDTFKIVDGSIGTNDIGPGAVTGAKVQDASLGAADIAAPNASNSPLTGTVALDPGNVVAGTCSIETVTLNGVASADHVIANAGGSGPADALEISALTPGAPNQLRFRVCNRSGSDVDDGATTISFIVIR
jgi:hypothetical protein